MANITENLNAIKNARYGKDVRNAIHDSIQAMNTESSNAQQVAIESQTSCLASKNASAESERLAHVYMEQAMSGTPDGYNSFHNAVTLGRTSILIPSNKFANCVGYKDDNKVGTYTIGATVNLTNAFGGGTISFGFADENGADDSASGMYTFDNWSTGVKSFTASISNTATKYKYLKITLTDCTLVGVGLVEGTVANYKYTDEIPLKPILDTLTLGSTIQTASATDHSLSTSEGGIRVDNVVGKTFKSANLLKPTLTSATTSNGVTVTPLGGGKFNVSGTASALASIKVGSCYLNAGNYKVVGTPPSGSGSTYTMFAKQVNNNVATFDNNEGATFTVATADTCDVYIRVLSGKTASNAVYIPMITEDLTATYNDFVPYGIHSSGSYGCVDLGSLTWTYGTASGVTRFKASYDVPKTLNTSVPNAYCNEYNVNSFTKIANSSLDRSIYFNQESNGICIVDTRFTDASLFTEHLKGTLLAYEVADGQTPNAYAEVWDEQSKNFCGVIEQGVLNENGVNATSTTRVRTRDYSKVTEGQSYTVSGKVGNANCRVYVYFYNESYTKTTSITWQTCPYTFTVPSGSKYARFIFDNNNATISPSDLTNPQIEQGTEATTYVPYHHSTVILPLAEPLRSVGDVHDYIDVENECIVRKVKTLTQTFSTSTKDSSNKLWYLGTINDIYSNTSADVVSNLICSEYQTNSLTQSRTSSNNSIVHYSNALFVRDDSVSDSFSKELTLVYELATPTTTPLSTDQKKALHSFKSFSGKTVITSQDLADAKPTLSVSYGTSDAVAQALLGVEIAKSNQAMIEEQIAEVQAMILELETTV